MKRYQTQELAEIQPKWNDLKTKFSFEPRLFDHLCPCTVNEIKLRSAEFAFLDPDFIYIYIYSNGIVLLFSPCAVICVRRIRVCFHQRSTRYLRFPVDQRDGTAKTLPHLRQLIKKRRRQGMMPSQRKPVSTGVNLKIFLTNSHLPLFACSNTTFRPVKQLKIHYSD